MTYEQVTQEVRDAFAALCKGRVEAAVLAEREACAMVCDALQDCGPENGCCPTYWDEALEKAAAAIRARAKP